MNLANYFSVLYGPAVAQELHPGITCNPLPKNIPLQAQANDTAGQRAGTRAHTALIDDDTDHVSAVFSDAPCIFSPACNSTLESSGCVWPSTGCRPSTNYFINMCAYKAHNLFTCTHLPVLSIQTNRPFSIYLHLVLLVPPPPPPHQNHSSVFDSQLLHYYSDWYEWMCFKFSHVCILFIQHRNDKFME